MQYTVDNQGYLNEVEEFIREAIKTYKSYLIDLLTAKRVEELSLNEMARLRFVSSSSILSMTQSGHTKLEILNKPVCSPAIQKSKPLTKDAVAEFLSKLSPEERTKLLGL